MAKAENKTMPTGADVDAFLNAVEHKTRREDSLVLKEMMTRISVQPATMWGPTLIGFGHYHYKYDSGREGEFFWCGFSPRKANLSLYINPGYGQYEKELSVLGKHKTGAACVYINKLADVDLGALESLIQACVAEMRTH